MDNVENVAAPAPEVPLTPAQVRKNAIVAYHDAIGRGDQQEAHRLNRFHKLGFSDANVPAVNNS